MSYKEKKQELEVEISTLEKTIEDWETAQSSFDKEWETIVRLHNEQAKEYKRQIEQAKADLYCKEQELEELTNVLIEDAEEKGGFSKHIEDYYKENGVTEDLLNICNALYAKALNNASDEQREEWLSIIGSVCDEDSARLFLNAYCEDTELAFIATFLKM
jgi:uncharacterized protein YhaN